MILPKKYENFIYDNSNEFIQFTHLFDYYIDFQSNYEFDPNYSIVMNKIIDRIIYQCINKNIYSDIINVCNNILKYYYSKSNPDIYDFRCKCFCQQFLIQYNYFEHNLNNIQTCIYLCDININQSLFYHNIDNKYIQNDIIILYNHFFENYECSIKKMNMVELSNFIGSFFNTFQSINTISLFILNNFNCDQLFNCINNATINELIDYMNKVEDYEICNSTTFIFYINYIKLLINNYKAIENDNVLIIIQNYRYLYYNSKEHYFDYLNRTEQIIGLNKCIISILKLLKSSFKSCVEFIYYYEIYIYNNYVPKYLYIYAKYFKNKFKDIPIILSNNGF